MKRSLRDWLATNSWFVAICVLTWTPLQNFPLFAAEDTVGKSPHPETAAKSKAIFMHAVTVYAVAFSPDGKTVLTGSDDNTARLWDAASGEPLGKTMQHRHSVVAVAFSPNGKTVLTGSGDWTARLWDAATGEPVK